MSGPAALLERLMTDHRTVSLALLYSAKDWWKYGLKSLSTVTKKEQVACLFLVALPERLRKPPQGATSSEFC